MRKKIGFILYLITFVGNLMAQSTESIPVMRVYFDGFIARDMPYINGQMQLTDTDGSVVELPAKFRTRGATAQEYLMKPSLNMKLLTADSSEEADSALLGMRSCSSWILDAMAIDVICMRNRVAFDIWNEFSKLPYDTDFNGRNGTDGRFIEMYINDKYYGIYCLSDRINRKLLNLKKVKEEGDGNATIRGVLYKSGTQNILNQNEPTYSDDSITCVIEWHNAWELKYPEEYAGSVVWQPLQDAYANGRNAEYVKKYFYLENLADYQLFVMALAIVDNWGNKNRFFSIRNISKNINDADTSESDRRRFVVTPWDLDTSLGGSFDGTCYDNNYTEWPVDIIPKIAPYPNSEIQKDPDFLNILKRRWIEGRETAFSIASVKSKLERYRNLFLKSGAWQRMVDHFEAQSNKPKYVTDLTHEINLIENWYVDRFYEMDAYFGIVDPDGINEIRNEEISFKNDEALYDLSGRRVNSSQLSREIFIKNHKKVLIQP